MLHHLLRHISSTGTTICFCLCLLFQLTACGGSTHQTSGPYKKGTPTPTLTSIPSPASPTPIPSLTSIPSPASPTLIPSLTSIPSPASPTPTPTLTSIPSPMP